MHGRRKSLFMMAFIVMATFLIVGLSVLSSSNKAAIAASADRQNPVMTPIDTANLVFGQQQIADEKQVFRYDTFGDEDFWGGKLRLHEAVAKITPKQALQLGLKVDMDAIPADVAAAIKAGKVNLDDPATTLSLLKLNAVVGVKGFFDRQGRLSSIGITCAFCHSRVDDAFAPGIGHRLDGWPNRDLNVGAIIASAPDLSPFSNLLEVDQATVKKVLNSWGPGKFDAELILDGKAFRPDGKSAATLIPPAYGLAGVNLSTWTGWGTVTYWNAFVANLEMNGKGTFFDSRLDNAKQFPIAAKAKLGHKRDSVDLITPKLAALHVYQLSIPAPTPPRGSFDPAAAARGSKIFNNPTKCARCHVPPLTAEPGWNMHKPQEIGIDSFQADRSPDRAYRTPPINGIWAHQKGGFFHDGRFPTLLDVVNHYNKQFDLKLSEQDKKDLVQYMLSLPEPEDKTP